VGTRGSTGWRWVAATVTLAVIASLVVWQVREDEPLPAGRIATVPPVGIAVMLSRPGGGTAPAVVGVPVPLDVEIAATAGVTAIELWAGSELVATARPADPLQTHHRLSFVPEATGHLTLLARAVDADERAGQSPALRLPVAEPYAPWVVVTATADGGETLATIAERHDVDVTVAAGVNPTVPADGPVPAGTVVSLPRPAPELDRPLEPEMIPATLRRVTGTTAEDVPAPAATLLPSGPAIEVDVHGCELDVSLGVLPEDADGVALHLLGPKDRHHTVVATFERPGTWTGRLGPGSHVITASAYDDGGHAWSAPVAVELPAGCGAEHAGEVRLVDGELSGGADADAAYLYVSADGGGWQRVPDDPRVFAPRTGDSFDLSPYLSDLDGQELELDAWGWRGAELVHIGTGRVTVPAQLDLNAIVGAGQGIWLSWVDDTSDAEVLRPAARAVEARELTFQWSTARSDVTRAVWQVSTSPADATVLEPAGLLDEGELDGSDGRFTLDVAPLLAELSAEADSVQHLAPRTVHLRVVGYAGDRPVGAASPPLPVTIGPSLAELTAIVESEPRTFELDLHVTPPRAPHLSRMYCFQLVGWDPDEVDAAALERARGAGSASDLIGDLNAFSYHLFLSVTSALGQDIPLCAGACYTVGGSRISFGGDACDTSNPLEQLGESVGDLVLTLWDDVIVYAFTELKAFVVETLAEFGGCNLLVGEIGGAVGDVSEADAQRWCESAANAVVSAVMAAYGIPPSLPTSSELIEAAKGDLVALAVATAEGLGIPCDDLEDADEAAGLAGEDVPTCEELARDLLDEFQAAVDRQFRAQAASFGIVFPPGAIVVPHPDGQVRPAIVTVTVTPTPEPDEGCPVMLLSNATWRPSGDDLVAVPDAGAVMTSLFGVEETASEPREVVAEVDVPYPVRFAPRTFEAPPFLAVTRPLPVAGEEVRVGSTFSSELVTGATVRLYESGYLPPVGVLYGSYTGRNWTPTTIPYHALLLHEGASFTVTALSSCAGVTSRTVTVPGIPR
jgi:hypothetical protein